MPPGPARPPRRGAVGVNNGPAAACLNRVPDRRRYTGGAWSSSSSVDAGSAGGAARGAAAASRSGFRRGGSGGPRGFDAAS